MGTFTFYSKDNLGGSVLGTLDDANPRNMNLKKERNWKNDEIRSVGFSDIGAGTILELWDSPDKRDSDDWIRVEFTQQVPSGKIKNVERNPNLPGVSFRKTGSGNLAGKVSHIVILPHGKASQAYLGIESSRSWAAKDGRAFEYEVSDSNFRVWKPSVTRSTGGVVLVFKLDHIRGLAKDDAAAVTMVFDGAGILQSESVELKFAGENPVAQALDARNAAAKELADAATDPRAKALLVFGAMVGAMQSSLVTSVAGLSQSGGRQLFPGVITAQMKELGAIVRDALVPPDGHEH